jgi:hypothetical protein
MVRRGEGAAPAPARDAGYDVGVTRYFTIDAANEALAEVGPLLATLADQRAELIRLRDRTVAASGGVPGTPGRPAPAEDPEVVREADPEEARRLHLRMQGVIDQMAAAVARIDALGITLRDIERGLIDFPALVAGRQVWLCWQLGEPGVDHWHDLETGFDSRRPLSELA